MTAGDIRRTFFVANMMRTARKAMKTKTTKQTYYKQKTRELESTSPYTVHSMSS